MFETLVTGLLTSALGNYIDPKCFSSDKINVAVWSGYVVLHALEIKPNVIAHPALNLVRGMVGSIELKIPWNRLHSDSVVVTIDDVYLLVRTEEEIERVMLEMDEFAIKKKLLEELYAQAKKQQEEEESAPSSSSEKGFAARLINKIIDNLELHVRRIHVRLEDYGTGDHPFALGLTIESVHVQSTNSSWQPSYVDASKSNEPRIYKIVELNHLSVYLNPDCNVFRNQEIDFETCSLEEFSSFFNRSIPKRFDDRHYQHMQLYPSHQQHHFLLKPIDANARLIVNRDPFDNSGPKFELDVSVPEVALRLEDSQYCDLLYLASAFQVPDHVAKYQQYKRLRPRNVVLDAEPGEWWQYAINAVMQDVRNKKQRWSWAYMKQRRDDRKRYVSAWERKSRHLLDENRRGYTVSDSEEDEIEEEGGEQIQSGITASDDEDDKRSIFSSGDESRASSKSGSSSDGNLSILEEIERRRPVEDILLFRYLADRRVLETTTANHSDSDRESKLPMPASATFSDSESVDTDVTESTLPTEIKFQSWGAWMFGWTSKLTASSDGLPSEAPRRVLPEVELRELYKILEYEPSKRSKNAKKKQKNRDHGATEDQFYDFDQEDQDHSVVSRITVTLEKGSLTLSSDPEANKKLERDDPSFSKKYAPTDFLLGTFSHLQLAAVAKNDAMKVDVSLQSIEAFDESAESSSFSRLLSRKQSGVLGGNEGDGGSTNTFSGPVFLMSYETNPVNSSADAALFIHLDPLEIVLSPTARCWGRLTSYLNTPKVLGLWAELEVASLNDIVNLKARTEAKLKYAMANRIALSVDLRIQAPVLIIPESDTDINCARLVVDLGHINFRTDRLSKLDGDSVNNLSSSTAALNGAGGSSLMLLNPSSSPNLTSSTSFVKQLYDEAEKGEGAIRWKEEFYDKFSITVTNIHVLLVPYGKKRHENNPVASVPPQLGGTYYEEQDYELIQRFNINVTLRTSVLPLDATLTRVYVHADLPALTFNMSLEKYFQLIYLVDRFSIAKSPATDASQADGGFFDSTDLFEGLDSNPFDQDDRLLSLRKNSFLSTSMLKRFMLDDDESYLESSTTETTQAGTGDSDEESSTGSDDTWFSITSGNVDLNLPSVGSMDMYADAESYPSDRPARSNSTTVPSVQNSQKSPRPGKKAKRKVRTYQSTQRTELLDRRLLVCTFTFPLISIQLKKPASSNVPASASYRYDGSDFEEDFTDNGTILVKLQGLRIRLARKTLSTQANVSFRSLEVEDYLDASGKSSEFLLFSCPTISAPFSMRAPQRRSGKFMNVSAIPRRRPSRQRERVISFQRADVAHAPNYHHNAAPPENLLDLIYSSTNDSMTGDEVLRDVDIRVGSIQFNFDQSYICSLLELIDETSTKLALVPASVRSPDIVNDAPQDEIDDILPPLELTPSIHQEYSLPMSLTESVRADLEKARKVFLKEQNDSESKNLRSSESAQRRKPVMLKLTARFQSMSVCFGDRGEPEASVAVLRLHALVNTTDEGDLVVKGTIGDVKLFDLNPKKSTTDGQSDGFTHGSSDHDASRNEYTNIFGLDVTSNGTPHYIAGLECRVANKAELDEDACDGVSSEPKPRGEQKSKLSITIQPVQLLVQPDFVENMTSYILDGPLRMYLLTRGDAHGLHAKWPSSGRHPRSQSFALENSSFHDALLLSPPPNSGFMSPQLERLTPFFDAIGTSNKRAEKTNSRSSPPERQLKVEIPAVEGSNENVQEKEKSAQQTSVLGEFDIELKVLNASIVLPFTQADSPVAGGLRIDLGTLLGTIEPKLFGAKEGVTCSWAGSDVNLAVSGMEIKFVHEQQITVLEKTGIRVHIELPTHLVPVESTVSGGFAEDLSGAPESPGTNVSVTVSPVCFNVGDKTICLGLDVFYGTIKPILDIAKVVGHKRDRDDADSLLGSVTIKEDFAIHEEVQGASDTTQVRRGGMTAIIVLEEIKLVLLAYSEAPQQFEVWMKNAVDASEEAHSRDAGTAFGNGHPGSPRKQRHDDGGKRSISHRVPDSTIIAEVAAVGMQVKASIKSFEVQSGMHTFPAKYEFSLQQATIRDKVADPEEFIVDLFGAANHLRKPSNGVERAYRQSMSNESHAQDRPSSFDLRLRQSLSLGDAVENATSNPDDPQLIVRLNTSQEPDNENSNAANSLVVCLASARFNVLPRTLLRLEHFGMEAYMAAKRRMYHLQLHYKPRMLVTASTTGNHAYMDGFRDFSDTRAEDSMLRANLLPDREEQSRSVGLKSERKESIAESAKDSDAKRSTVMSPVGQRLIIDLDVTHRKLSTSELPTAEESLGDQESIQVVQELDAQNAANANAEKNILRWMMHIELLNVQLWLLSTEKKAEAAGVKLSANLRADMSSSSGDQKHPTDSRMELLTGSAEINDVEVCICSPVEELVDVDSRNAKGVHFPWTIVEPFNMQIGFSSALCTRRLQTKDEKKVVVLSETAAPLSTFEDNQDLFNNLLSELPLEWQEWVLHQPSLQVDEIISRISYRNFPVLLKTGSSLSSMIHAEDKIRQTFTARMKSLEEEFEWNFADEPHDENYRSSLEKHDAQAYADEMNKEEEISKRVVTMSTLHMGGVQFKLINNIVDQESPVVGFNIAEVNASHQSKLNDEFELLIGTTVDAWYHNLRLVTSEPLIEPWKTEIAISKKPTSQLTLNPTGPGDVQTPLEVTISSKDNLQFNLTEAFIANSMAANRAWKWVVNEGGDPREMTEYSTYWIRNNTGLNLHYWGKSCKASTLLPGGEEPLEFVEADVNEEPFFNDQKTGDGFQYSGNGEDKSYPANNRQIYISVYVDQELTDDESSHGAKWQSETAIPVDQVDSRMYALVDTDGDNSFAKLRKCECVIDVLVERGCKFFVVRSTLLLENNTGSDLEVEFMPPPARYVSRISGSTGPHGMEIPSWKSVVKASSVVPVPLHLVSLGEGYVLVRPPEIQPGDVSTKTLPKAYAKARVRLPLLDRDTVNANVDELESAQNTMKFHRLYSDRPVRPFVMNACLSNSNGAVYHRTLSFHPPLVLHNLTAGPLEFCLFTPSDWTPGAKDSSKLHQGWEDSQQRLRERGVINVADTLVWHLSDWDTPLELSVRMKGFEWSEPILLSKDVVDFERIKMKDVVTDSYLYITAESEVRESKCREIFLYVPYWIVNLTGLKLEYEYDEERIGHEHLTTMLAGQKRLDREELLLKENQRARLAKHERNPHLVYAPYMPNAVNGDGADLGSTSQSDELVQLGDDGRTERKRRHPCLLPGVPPIKGLLDLLPKSMEDPKALGQLEVLQVCHSDYRLEKGCVRLRVNDDEVANIDSAKENSQRRWSDVITLDQTGTSGEIEAADYGASKNYSIGYSISAAKGRYSRTKVVMLTPRFMLINTLDCAIEVCHSSAKFSGTTTSAIDIGSSVHLPNNGMMSSMNSVVHLEAGAYADFHWTLRFGKTRAIRCRLAEYGWSWSGAVPLGESGEYAVRMRHESTRESKLLRLTLKLDGSCVCVYFREESASAPPYRVENYSLETLRIHQHRVRRSEILLPHHSLDYAWDEPTQERMLVVDMLPSAAGDNSRPLRIGTFLLDKIQRYPDALGGTLGIEVSTDGPTRVLRFTDARLRGDRSNDLLAVPSDNTTTKESGGHEFLCRFVTAPSLHLVLQLQGVGVSVVDGIPKELMYMSVSGIFLEVIMSEEDREKTSAFITGSDGAVSRLERETTARIIATRFEISDVQIDNQLQTTPFPVLLRFSNSASRSQNVNGEITNVPALQIYLVKHDEYAGINFIRHFSATALPVHIRVDGSLLSHLAPLMIHANASTDYMGKSKSGAASGGVRNNLLLEDFNASLEVNVKILAAIREEGESTSAAPSNASLHTNRSSMHENYLVSTNGQNYSASIPVYPIQGKFVTKDEEKKLYFEEFYIDPIRATVSFTLGSGASAIVDGQYGGSASSSSMYSFSDSSRNSSVITVGPLRLILNAIGTSLTKIANAPFKLKALEINHSFMQPDALVTRLTSHYQSEALRQAYVILGSVDVLGNPMIAWKNLKGGFQDFIYEPAYGISKSPQEFAFGMGRGTLSLVRASVYTFLDFNSRILTASSLGLSEACLKLDDYTGYPATRNIYQGFAQGISGIVVSPIHSVEVNGIRGVIPGIFAGVFGLVLKPLLGISLAAATTTATLRDAVDPNTKALLRRVRPPRFIDFRTRRLKVYSYIESLGEEIVSKLRGGRYRADGYLGHVDLKQKCFLVTRKRILLLDVRGSQKYDVEWELLADEVVMIESKGHDEMTIYFIREEFNQRRRAPVVLNGMLLNKYVVALPDSKMLFVRAMLQQMERSLITKTNSGSIATEQWALGASPIDRSPWPVHHQQRGAFEYPMFRIPTLLPTRSFSSLSQPQPQQQQ
uniref:Vacuolar protein sorting-associated protein n=1 Tax=Globisporangium ultimum (strain ATCC 200006 / CBS 805.95 / DAOM BR144) TaxID=431595 RepID=K3WU58_GLOUD